MFRGKVSDRELRAAFARAGVYVSLSEHEGFGVPLLEAMAARVPVVAYASSAVPETLGGAGILLRTQDPATVAATVETLRIRSRACGPRLVDRQSDRVAQVGPRSTCPGALRRLVDRAEGPRAAARDPGPGTVRDELQPRHHEPEAGPRPRPARPTWPCRCIRPRARATTSPTTPTWRRHPEVVAPYRRSAHVPYPDVVIRQMWPPRTIDSPGGITLEYFAWEESRVPAWMVEDFNAHLDGIGVYSAFVRRRPAGLGRDGARSGWSATVSTPPTRDATIEAPELEGRSGSRSSTSARPSPARGSTSCCGPTSPRSPGRTTSNLVLKTFPNPHNTVAELLDELRAGHADPPDVRWIDRDLDDDELAAPLRPGRLLRPPVPGRGLRPTGGRGHGWPGCPSSAWPGRAWPTSCPRRRRSPSRSPWPPPRAIWPSEGSQWAEPDVGCPGRRAGPHGRPTPSAPDVVGAGRACPSPHRHRVLVGRGRRAVAGDFIDEVEDEVG